MKNLYIVFLVLTLSLSCKEIKTTDSPEPKVMEINKGDETEIIIQKILDLPKIEWMYHQEIADRIPIKLVANEIINDSLKLQKFNKRVRIASLSSFEKEKIQDYLSINELRIEADTAYFDLTYDIEGVNAKGKLAKTSGEWIAQEYFVDENNRDTPEETKLQVAPKDSILTLAYNGADLGYLAQRYYGNRAYRYLISTYNNFEDKPSIDKKHDSIKIPELSYLTRDESLPKLQAIAEYLDKAIKARNLYRKQESSLYRLPVNRDNGMFRKVSQTQKLELLGVSKLMYECVSGLEQNANPPKKAIGQFRQVAENFENIANGIIDDGSYAFDMVHQRMAHGFSNCIKWAKEN